MAEEYHHHDEPKKMEESTAAPVETTDRGVFDFMKKKDEDKPQEGVIASEFEEKVQVSESECKKEEEKKPGGVLHRSHSSSSSSSDEEEGDDEEKKKKKKEKKSLKEKIKEKLPGEHKEEEEEEEDDKEKRQEGVEKIHVEEVVYSEPSQPAEEKKGLLNKIKEKLPGQQKKADDAACSPPPTPVQAECTPTPVQGAGAPEHEGEEKEKKGFLDKIKDKIPGFHSKGVEEKEKEKDCPPS